MNHRDGTAGDQIVLEQAVREMLQARSAQVTVSPDAWEHALARAGRSAGYPDRMPRPAGGRLRPWLAPLAASAMALVIGIATAAIVDTGGRHPVTAGAGGVVGPDWSAAPVCDYRTEGGAISPADPRTSGTVALGGHSLPPAGEYATPEAGEYTAWFQQTAGSAVMCMAQEGGHETWAPVPQLGSARPVSFENFDCQPELRAPYALLQVPAGLAVRSITSVEAVLANGRDIQGSVVTGQGFPYAMWWVRFQSMDPATLVFRDAAGNVVSHLDVGSPARLPQASQTVCGMQSFSGVSVPGPVTSQGKFSTSFSFFRKAGGSLALFAEGRAGSSGMSVELAAGIPAGQVAKFIDSFAAPSSLFGTAVQSVAAVTAVLPDGRSYKGTVIDGPGFPYKVWQVYCPRGSSTPTLVFTDKAGHVLGELNNPVNPQASGPPLSVP
jgi:hypothetical protein